MYKVKDEVVLKIHDSGDIEELCMVSEIEGVIAEDKKAIHKLEDLLKNRNTLEDSALSIMLFNYVTEVNSLNKIKLLNQ